MKIDLESATSNEDNNYGNTSKIVALFLLDILSLIGIFLPMIYMMKDVNLQGFISFNNAFLYLGILFFSLSIHFIRLFLFGWNYFEINVKGD